MKYIRVKDMSLEWITTFIDYDRARNKATELGLTYSVKIVRQADTIEELCDEFIVTATSHYTAYIAQTHTLEEAIEYCENNHMPKTKIRGAIWTKKGLIYVAKMNDKGELKRI